MDPLMILIIFLFILVLLLGSGTLVGVSLLSAGAVSLALFHSVPVDKLLGQVVWNTISSSELIALPLFIFMAEILYHTKLTKSLFNGLSPITNWLPGKLMHVNVLACTLFAAVSGSSAATTVSVGRITVSELINRKYDKKLVIGSLAGAGTLGLLIPPSIILIIYGVLSETSILQLFIAGIFPGLLLALAYMTYIGICATILPDSTPVIKKEETPQMKLQAVIGLLPAVLLIFSVMGSMYFGIASPSEAASIGVLGAVIISIFQKELTWSNFSRASISAVCTISMICLIIIGASFMAVAMGFLGIPAYIAEQISLWGLPPIGLIFVLLIFYAILGCLLDGLSAIVLTLHITLPLVLAAGYDKIWFGIFLVVVVEMSQITPPVGFNLFVIQGLTGEGIGFIARAALPFFLIMALFTIVISIFPGIITFFPNLLAAF